MQREKEIYKVTLVGGAVNVVLLLFKFVAGIIGHSSAMIADAAHSLSDFVTDIIVLVFVKEMKRAEESFFINKSTNSSVRSASISGERRSPAEVTWM